MQHKYVLNMFLCLPYIPCLRRIFDILFYLKIKFQVGSLKCLIPKTAKLSKIFYLENEVNSDLMTMTRDSVYIRIQVKE